MQSIDLNCDMGESYGNFLIGNDVALMPYISSCNIACGFHAGDPVHILQTLMQAKSHHLRIGAHPGYPDLNGFGRRSMSLSELELRAIILYQVSAVAGMAASIGAKVSYVKPHGALYNSMVHDRILAINVVGAIKEVDATLGIMGLAGSQLAHWVEEAGMSFIAEAFADRRYNDEGSLLPRSDPRAVISDPGEAAEQVAMIVNESCVKTNTDSYFPIDAESICIHGDNKNALSILIAINEVVKVNSLN
jgi:UPF0271 protein